MKVKRGLFDVGFWALAVWVMVLGHGALVIGDDADPLCDNFDVHTATAETILTSQTMIDHPLTNGNHEALVFATPNWNPRGQGGTYNNSSIGVYYISGRWTVVNQYNPSGPTLPMVEGVSFNFKVVPPSESSFVHTTTRSNTSSDPLSNYWTRIDHPLTNGHPEAVLFVTPNVNPVIGRGTFNYTPIGVIYNGTHWLIFNQDDSSMPLWTHFNVQVTLPSESTFIHSATAGSITSNWTVINHPLTNGNRNAIVIVTQNFNSADGFGQSNNHSIGVWYDGSNWAIFNQDRESMVSGVSFNVTVYSTPDVFVHTATEANIHPTGSYRTAIDNPSANGEPDALLFVTQNWNPDGVVPGTFNASPIGVRYNGSAWEVANQITTNDIPVGAAFNIKVARASESTFIHTATVANRRDATTMLNHPLVNGNTDVLMFVTQNWNPGGGSFGIANNAPIGLWYVDGTWAIFNENGNGVPEGAAFNVMVTLPSESAFVHTATVDNITGGGYTTDIDHPMTNGNPDARLLVTQSWIDGAGGARNNAPIGVWYNNSNSKWAILNQDITPLPLGASFNVKVLAECDRDGGTCDYCLPADYNDDGFVNSLDFGILAGSWLEHTPSGGVVYDLDDLAELSLHWLKGSD